MLKKIFDANNPLMQLLSMAANLLMLNLLTLLCSLPIVTAGAAYAALNDLCIHIVRGEDTYILRPFFRSFRANFKRGTLLWLLVLLAAALVWLDFQLAETWIPPLRYPVLAVGLICLAVALYAFALLSRYDNRLGATLKNAAALAVAFFPRTAAVLVIQVGVWVGALSYLAVGLPLLLLFGLSLPCYLCALLFNGVFQQLDSKTDASAGNPPA